MNRLVRRALSLGIGVSVAAGLHVVAPSASHAAIPDCNTFASVSLDPPTVCIYTGYLGTEYRRTIVVRYGLSPMPGGAVAGVTIEDCFYDSYGSGCTSLGHLTGAVVAPGYQSVFTFPATVCDDPGTCVTPLVAVNHNLSNKTIYGVVGIFPDLLVPFEVPYDPCFIISCRS